jgi:hypothetical protein
LVWLIRVFLERPTINLLRLLLKNWKSEINEPISEKSVSWYIKAFFKIISTFSKQSRSEYKFYYLIFSTRFYKMHKVWTKKESTKAIETKKRVEFNFTFFPLKEEKFIYHSFAIIWWILLDQTFLLLNGNKFSTFLKMKNGKK